MPQVAFLSHVDAQSPLFLFKVTQSSHKVLSAHQWGSAFPLLPAHWEASMVPGKQSNPGKNPAAAGARYGNFQPLQWVRKA